MYEQLKERLADLLRRPRAMRPQAERQLNQQLAEHGAKMASFLLGAANVLEEHELDILFASVFTPTLGERAELADLLYHWRPSADDQRRLVDELREKLGHVTVGLPDGSQAKLGLHEVMLDRFVRLLRLDCGPDSGTAAALRDALPAALWPLAMALSCERGMTKEHQAWFAAFVNHSAGQHAMTRGLLETVIDFVSKEHSLKHDAILAAAEALMRATQSVASFTAGGHNYWSPDVAQHHHFRGQGNVDRERLATTQADLENVTMMVEDLRTFDVTKV
ncbi:MAG: hypothetical protein WD768_16680 [Phycisphaeraceae bacterium]